MVFNMFNSKKALSPLIAAVLLIVVVVGIGAVVVGMTRGMVSDNQDTISQTDDRMSCSRDVVIQILKLDRDPQICKGSNYINVVIENIGTVDIEDFQLLTYGTTGVYNNESIGAGTLSKGGALELNATYDTAQVGTLQQAKFIPKLKKSGATGYHFCSEVALKYEDINDC
ncbi:hypothetical protein KY349_01200 [Candidatus Woesearchaeota archaeon]|jgi:FlaG/FlaF family flagellin (archaellin)|nr:hypothetical protein [Candidatus Woesearchaeota archaeon]